ncbi:uncharacterized protein KGF55_004868 [Candida pseudojiufengensis]|uniref:uncharacterized protein n=1 Tax=Candida pseudojiufengensis TaxID=497109 RepID=UPI0022241784|nr:uncharacterized protein KGF55_004868 [Candida pseudojiufengensis]KAI5960145.1 hypothetical protein KGF55_004868 [Candida pseudojiufengensis]
MNTKTPIKDYTASLYRLSAKWLTTPYENPTKSNLKIALTLRNVFIWLILINVINYNLRIVVNFGNIDVVQVLGKQKGNNLVPQMVVDNEDDLKQRKKLENILIGMYVRNEEVYLKNIDLTTVYSKVYLKLSDYKVRLIMDEGLVSSDNFKYDDDKKITSIINWILPSDFPIFNIMKNQNSISRFLRLHLNKLFPLNSNHQVIIKQINQVYKNLIIGKFIILINSIIILSIYILMYYCPKRLSYHYINLFALYFMNFFNCAVVLMMIISRQKITSVKDHQLGLLIVELFSILGFNLVFYQSHDSIMNTYFVQFTPTASSIYSEKEDDIDTSGNNNVDKVGDPEIPSTTAGLTGRTATRNLRANPQNDRKFNYTTNNKNLPNSPKSPYEYQKSEFEQRRSATAPILSSITSTRSPNYTEI